MLKIGNNNIGSVALGDTSIGTIYKGSDLIFTSIPIGMTVISNMDTIIVD